MINKHYWNRYIKFIEWCDQRPLWDDAVTQRHHIMPKSFGGDDSPDNIIVLTYREHFIAHLLLYKATKDQGMAFACISMLKDGSLKSRELDIISKILSESRSGENHPMYGRHHSEESKRKNSESSKGQIPWNKGKTGVYSEETIEAIKKARSKQVMKTGWSHSEESKKKMSLVKKGRKQPTRSREHREKLSIVNRNPELVPLYNQETYQFEYITRFDIKEKYVELQNSNINAVCRGERRSSKSWVLGCDINNKKLYL